jgi:hypothetical protein
MCVGVGAHVGVYVMCVMLIQYTSILRRQSKHIYVEYILRVSIKYLSRLSVTIMYRTDREYTLYARQMTLIIV